MCVKSTMLHDMTHYFARQNVYSICFLSHLNLWPYLLNGQYVKCVSKVLGQLSDSRTSYIASVTILQRAG